MTAPAAMAQTYGGDNEGVWNKLLKSVGVNSAPDPNSDINYTERPPLVVPPGRDLPPPVADPAAPATNWPTSNPKTVKHAKSKTEVIPDTAVQNPNPPFEKKPWYNPAGWFSKEQYGTFAGEPVRRISRSRRPVIGSRRRSSLTVLARTKRTTSSTRVPITRWWLRRRNRRRRRNNDCGQHAWAA